MRIYHDISEIPPSSAGVTLAIGNFDGMHLGHQALVLSSVRWARERNFQPCALTFSPHPVEIIRSGTVIPAITTQSDKARILEELGIGLVLVQRFSLELSRLGADVFFEKFVKAVFGAKAVFVGDDFRFGHERKGDPAMLATLGRAQNIETCVQPEVSFCGERISSTLIRKLIIDGDMPKARALLGRPYLLTGLVVAGSQRGRLLGIPTANIVIAQNKLIPAFGVYAARFYLGGQSWRSVVNIGVRPTFGSDSKPTIEAHVLDFDQSLYGENIGLELFERLRPEQKFESKEALVSQIHEDIHTARACASLD